MKIASYVERKWLGHHEDKLPPRGVFVVGWTGMRGVLALAAAISIPEVMGDGRPFEARNLIVFLAFCVIFVTLVVQGLTLPVLIRSLGLQGTTGMEPEEKEARRIVLRAAIRFLEEGRRVVAQTSNTSMTILCIATATSWHSSAKRLMRD